MRAYQPDASMTIGSALWFRAWTRTARARGDHVKRNGRSFRRGRFCRVLDYSQLKRQPDLGRGEPDARGLAHGLPHQFNELLNLRAQNLCGF